MNVIEQDLIQLAVTTPYNLYQVKELHKMVSERFHENESVFRLRQILDFSCSRAVNPVEIIELIPKKP